MTNDADSAALAGLAAEARAWPFEEARKVVERLAGTGDDRPIVFETGYGPSGLPHIGTFGEVARTTMVRHAFEVLTEGRIKTRLICFSDDMDGLRKVPDNIPNKEMLGEHLGRPLTKVPDPFGKFESFGHHNNAMLRDFLDRFAFDYEFVSSTDYYVSGRFDATLLKVLAHHDEIRAIVTPILGPERRATYSPILPICPRSGEVLQVAIDEVRAEAGTVIYRDPESGDPVEVPVTGGHCKLQWRADWAMRWAALGVDYEMSGKDLIDSVKIGGRICKTIGGTPPEGFNYELFLDENGEKISKSRGNGITIDQWLTYATPESLSLFMFQKPKTAKRLYFDVIPRAVDEYYQHLSAYDRQEPERQLANPVWHVHSSKPPSVELPVSFALLLNLVSASNADDRSVLWGFISRTAPGVTPESHPELDRLADYAIRYFNDFVAPTKAFRPPDEVERAALARLDEKLAALPADADAETIQNAILNVARGIERFQDHAKKSPEGGPGVSGAWFTALYEVLLGQTRGPRFGSFVALYGLPETRDLIARALQGELATETAS